jgi:DNA adenine methylase
MFYSPLRYPGGKNKLSAFLAKICVDNEINGHYVEPFAGGASVALFLLFEGYVDRITINDRDRSIYAFWHSVLNKTNDLCSLIEDAELNINEWRRQKLIQQNKDKVSLLELGFSTFYLNRTNRSGIINGGAIGGVEQRGNYLMDCRFNKENLIERIRKIATRKKDIRLYKKDAIKLIDKIVNESNDPNTIFYFDPPYYLKSSTLYMNHFNDEDHWDLSKKIKSIRNIKWIVSYDNVVNIRNLYDECEKKEFSFKHTAYQSRVGKEIMFFSENIIQPDLKEWNPVYFKKSKINRDIIYKEKAS